MCVSEIRDLLFDSQALFFNIKFMVLIQTFIEGYISLKHCPKTGEKPKGILLNELGLKKSLGVEQYNASSENVKQ